LFGYPALPCRAFAFRAFGTAPATVPPRSLLYGDVLCQHRSDLTQLIWIESAFWKNIEISRRCVKQNLICSFERPNVIFPLYIRRTTVPSPMGARNIQHELSWPFCARLFCVLSPHKPPREDSADQYDPQNGEHKEWQKSSGVMGLHRAIKHERCKCNDQPKDDRADRFSGRVPISVCRVCFCEISLCKFVLYLHGLAFCQIVHLGTNNKKAPLARGFSIQAKS
jgi:hypothetical protein